MVGYGGPFERLSPLSPSRVRAAWCLHFFQHIKSSMIMSFRVSSCHVSGLDTTDGHHRETAQIEQAPAAS